MRHNVNAVDDKPSRTIKLVQNGASDTEIVDLESDLTIYPSTDSAETLAKSNTQTEE